MKRLQYDDDPSLAAFLRAHAPMAPKASSDLQHRIFRTLADEKGKLDELDHWQGRPRHWHERLSVAAVFALCFGLLPERLGQVNSSHDIESFVEASWDGTFGNERELAYEALLAEAGASW